MAVTLDSKLKAKIMFLDNLVEKLRTGDDDIKVQQAAQLLEQRSQELKELFDKEGIQLA